MRTDPPCRFCALLVLCAALTHGQRAMAAGPEQPPELMVTDAQRTSLALTVYNSGIALVREARQVALSRRSRATIRFENVAPSILAPSVSLRLSPKPEAVRIVEQSYRYDVLTPRTLTRHADGANLSVLRLHPGSGELVRIQGQSLAAFEGGPPVLKTAEGITFYPSHLALAFDSLPARWSSRPSLSWLVDVKTPGPFIFHVAYLAGKLSWTADYVLTLARNPSDPATLVGWITLTNHSGMAFPSSKVSVVAGQVHVVTAGDAEEQDLRPQQQNKEARSGEAVRSSLGEYHLYELPEATELPDRSSKQVRFLSTTSLHPRWRYVAEPSGIFAYQHVPRGATLVQAAEAQVEFDVTEAQGLGVPIPQGTVRVFTPDSLGRAQWLGQRAVAHTPRDETVKLRLGPAPEIKLTRVLMERTRGPLRRDDRIQYKLRNAKPVEALVEVRERDGTLLHATLPATHPDAATTVFEVRVPAGGEVKWEAAYREGR